MVQLPPLEILYEDNHCIAVSKPAGVVTTHFQGTHETLDRAVKHYLKQKYGKPGNVFLGIVHRLDRPVSGVVLFARTSKAAGRLSEQFRKGTIGKIYWAIVEGAWPQGETRLEDRLQKNEGARRVEVVARGGQQAIVDVACQQRAAGLSWLELRPRTGRKHQLRVQLAQRGHPIYGDSKYGSTHRFDGAIALHARSLTFLHPVRNEPLTLTAKLPAQWHGRFVRLFPGGVP